MVDRICARKSLCIRGLLYTELADSNMDCLFNGLPKLVSMSMIGFALEQS
jgi:hypothetical protein